MYRPFHLTRRINYDTLLVFFGEVMGKLKEKQRNQLPDSKFALPEERKYPVDTPGRAANAKARATQMENRGLLSSSQKAQIDAKANKVLKK